MSITIETKARRDFAILALAKLKLVILAGVLLALWSIPVYAAVTITPTSWNVIGLDSNNPGSSGPDTYQIGGGLRNTRRPAATKHVWAPVLGHPHRLFKLERCTPPKQHFAHRR